MSDRKYRQRGYQDSGSEPRKAFEKPQKQETFGPRALQMPGTRMVSRCSQCGVVLQPGTDVNAKCLKCGYDLHSCKQCTYFDPSSRFECLQPIPARVSPKDVLNNCTFYSIRVTREKETSTGTAQVNDVRQAFDNLFKK